MTLPAFAAELRCLQHDARSEPQLSIDICPQRAQQQTRRTPLLCRSVGQTDGQTGGQTGRSTVT